MSHCNIVRLLDVFAEGKQLILVVRCQCGRKGGIRRRNASLHRRCDWFALWVRNPDRCCATPMYISSLDGNRLRVEIGVQRRYAATLALQTKDSPNMSMGASVRFKMMVL